MKTPWYDISPGATAALVATGAFVDIDLYTIFPAGALAGGAPLRYSAGTLAVTIPGTTWPRALLFDQARAKAVGHLNVGLDVDQWQVVVAPRIADPLASPGFTDRIGDLPFLAAAQAGALDGAEIQVDRAVAAAWPSATNTVLTPVGIVTLFYGRVAEIDVGRSQAVITINSHLTSLGNALPRNLFQAGCIHTLFDGGCALRAADFAMSGTVAAGSAGNIILSSIAAPIGSGTYALGRIVMSTGANAGFARLVRGWTMGSPGTFTLVAPFPFAVSPGDAFVAYPGCDKQFNTCGLFGNQPNFGGEIAIPAPETAV